MIINKIESQVYNLIRVEKNFEIRYYPAATRAVIYSNLKSYRDLGNSGFSKLAKYIFGENSDNKKIVMTSPIHLDIGDIKSTMAFILPSAYNSSNLPKPNDPSITILTSEPEYVAAKKFSGFATTESMKKQRLLLENALKDHGLIFYGNFRFLGYNPPFQLLCRRNEIIVALNADKLNM